MPFIKVSGKVNGIAWNGKLIKIYETYQGREGSKHRLWSCWFDIAPDINEGDEITVNGDLNCKIGSWTPKGNTEAITVVEYHLNEVTLATVVAAKPSSASFNAPEPSPAVLEDLNTPF